MCINSSIHYGAVLGAYVALEELGFGFLHPLSPTIPHQIRFPKYTLDIKEFPYWSERSFHVHTQHPLELTEVLQGHDIPMFGPHGSECEQEYRHSKKANLDKKVGKQNIPISDSDYSSDSDSVYCERWEDMVDDVDAMFEWAVANRLNKIEWLLLGNFKWGDQDTSDIRRQRLKIMTNIG